MLSFSAVCQQINSMNQLSNDSYAMAITAGFTFQAQKKPGNFAGLFLGEARDQSLRVRSQLARASAMRCSRVVAAR